MTWDSGRAGGSDGDGTVELPAAHPTPPSQTSSLIQCPAPNFLLSAPAFAISALQPLPLPPTPASSCLTPVAPTATTSFSYGFLSSGLSLSHSLVSQWPDLLGCHGGGQPQAQEVIPQ